MDRQHSCVSKPLASNRPLPRAFLCFCEPHLCQSETSFSFRSLDLPNFWLVSFESFRGLLVLQSKSKLYSYKLPLREAGWIQLEGVSFTPSVLQLFRIKRIRCQGADSTNTTYQKIFLRICIQRPHFSRFMAAMTTLLVCVRRLSNDLPAKFLEASEPFGAGRGRCDVHHFSLTGQCHRAHFVNQGLGTWWICCMAYDTMASLPYHPLSIWCIKVVMYRTVIISG